MVFDSDRNSYCIQTNWFDLVSQVLVEQLKWNWFYNFMLTLLLRSRKPEVNANKVLKITNSRRHYSVQKRENGKKHYDIFHNGKRWKRHQHHGIGVDYNSTLRFTYAKHMEHFEWWYNNYRHQPRIGRHRRLCTRSRGFLLFGKCCICWSIKPSTNTSKS